MAVTVATNLHLSFTQAAAPLLFPTETTTGTPSGWTPTSTEPAGLIVTTPGAVIEDVEIIGDLDIRADNVTVRRCRILNGRVRNTNAGVVGANFVFEDSDVIWSVSDSDGEPAVGYTNYTARNVKIVGAGEGFRASDNSSTPPGPILIENCYTRIAEPADPTEWHGDCLQGFSSTQSVTVRNSVLILDSLLGTGSIFYPGVGDNTGLITIDRVIAAGGGWTTRFWGSIVAAIEELYVVEGTSSFGPLDGNEAEPAVFEASLCTLDGDGQPIVGAAILW